MDIAASAHVVAFIAGAVLGALPLGSTADTSSPTDTGRAIRAWLEGDVEGALDLCLSGRRFRDAGLQ